MIRVPRFWRRFKHLMTVQDLLMRRKVLITVTDDEGNRHTSVEVVGKPMTDDFGLTPGRKYDMLGSQSNNFD